MFYHRRHAQSADGEEQETAGTFRWLGRVDHAQADGFAADDRSFSPGNKGAVAGAR